MRVGIMHFDLRIDIEPLLNLSINELKAEMKKSPKLLENY